MSDSGIGVWGGQQQEWVLGKQFLNEQMNESINTVDKAKSYKASRHMVTVVWKYPSSSKEQQTFNGNLVCAKYCSKCFT